MKDPIRKTLLLLRLLSDGQRRTISELEEILGVSSRMVYNYLNAFKAEGFEIDTKGGYPRLLRSPRLPLPFLDLLKANDSKLSLICDAIDSRHRVILRGYHSGNSNNVTDRLIEPVQFSHNNRQIYAYDVDKEGMRTFVLSRAEAVVPTDDPFQCADRHIALECDCFWMTGDIIEEITLQLDELALNLLHEEYPLSLQYPVIRDDDPLPYRLLLPVRSVYGAGRFLLGLPDHCRLLRGPRLRAHIDQTLAAHRPKHRPNTASQKNKKRNSKD